MSAGHSFLPPSGASAWIDCAQWPEMNRRYPQDDTAESIEGTAAHWVNTEMLAGHPLLEGTLAPNGVMITAEMLEGAEMFCDAIGSRVVGSGPLHIEETVTVPEIHASCYGTPDAWHYNAGSAHLEVFDYKFGHGFVDEWWNPQGILYVSGILSKLAPILSNPELVTVSFTIVQPRCFYGGKFVRTHNYTAREMAPHIQKLKRAAEYAYSSKPTARTGPYCDHCPGRHACDAAQKGAHVAASFASDRQPHDLTPTAAASELKMLEGAYGLLGARIDGLRGLVEAQLRAGERVPYYGLEQGRGRTAWTMSVDEVIALGQMFGKDLSKPGVVTPAQAAKNNLPPEIISAYSVLTPGSLKLVQVSNSKAAKAFGSGE